MELGAGFVSSGIPWGYRCFFLMVIGVGYIEMSRIYMV